MPSDNGEILRSILKVLEDEKSSGRVDTQLTNDVALLVSVTRLRAGDLSPDVIKRNIKTQVNAIMAARLIAGPPRRDTDGGVGHTGESL